jgi:hypothetical protein
MNKTKKIIWSIVLGLLVIVVIVVVIVGFSLGSIVKKGVETVGPEITKTSIALDAVDLSLLTGTASVKGLVVGNPPGYTSPESIRVGKVSVGVSPLSVLSDKIIVHSVEMVGPEITFEGNPLSKNNLGDIMDSVNQVAKNGGPAAASTNATTQPAGKPGKKLEVDDFLITGAKVHAKLTGVLNQELTLTLPTIHFSGLGTGPEGITATELTQRVLSEITSATVKALASNVSNLGSGAGKAATENLDKLKKGLGGLLGK